jgi:XTP/dITP diphosphohydrolase
MPLSQILLASANLYKVREISAMLEAEGIAARVLSLLEFPDVRLPEENAETFEENAGVKARSAAEQSGLIALADDSGLEVDAIEGAPGVRSKRFAGDNASDPARYEKLLSLMKDVPEEKRQARFRCCIAIAVPGQEPIIVEGIVKGKISFSPIGEHGFGYDPVFIPEGMNCTMAQLPMEEKNRISHRARALQAAIPVIKRLLNEPGK